LSYDVGAKMSTPFFFRGAKMSTPIISRGAKMSTPIISRGAKMLYQIKIIIKKIINTTNYDDYLI
jgi:hypothetical protein